MRVCILHEPLVTVAFFAVDFFADRFKEECAVVVWRVEHLGVFA